MIFLGPRLNPKQRGTGASKPAAGRRGAPIPSVGHHPTSFAWSPHGHVERRVPEAPGASTRGKVRRSSVASASG